MEIKPGYKLTEVGVIPEDWEIHTIGDSMRLINGRAFNSGDWKDQGLPIIRIQNLNDTESRFNHYSGQVEDRHRIKAGDILFAWSGTTGTSFGARIWAGPTGVLNQHIFKVVPNAKDLTHGYAFLILRRVQEHIEKRAHGFKASFVHVKKSELVGIQLPAPPTKAEQEAIVESLSDADTLIESLEQLISKKRHLKQGAMQQFITGKRRLRGFNNAAIGYKQTEAGVIPEDWGLHSLGEVVTFLDGKRRPVRDADRAKMRGSFPYYGASGIVDYVNDYIFDEDLILLGEDGENILSRNCRLAFRISGKAWVNNHAHVLKPNQDLCIGFLTEYLESLNYERFNSGTAQPKLNKQTCSRIPVALPPTKAEQEAIAATLSDMDSEIAALEAKLTKTLQIKQGMMHNLLIGKIRLI